MSPHRLDDRGWLGRGNLRAHGHPSGALWRQLYCRSWHGYFLETYGTIVHGKRLAVALLVRIYQQSRGMRSLLPQDTTNRFRLVTWSPGTV